MFNELNFGKLESLFMGFLVFFQDLRLEWNSFTFSINFWESVWLKLIYGYLNENVWLKLKWMSFAVWI